MYSQEFNAMKWKEFRSLLSGLNPDTPLGRVVQIRSETDPEILKQFTPGQKKIHDDWQRRNMKEISPVDMEKFLNKMLNFFVATGDIIEKDKMQQMRPDSDVGRICFGGNQMPPMRKGKRN